MRKLIYAALVMLTAVGMASAAPMLCNPDAIGMNVLSANFACQQGELLFSNFSSPDTAIVNLVSASGPDAGGVVLLDFNPNLVGPTAGDVHLNFMVSTPNEGYSITGLDLYNMGYLSAIQEAACTHAWTSPCTGSDVLWNTSASDMQYVSTTLSPQDTVYIYKNIGTNTGGHISDFQESFTQSGVPEPMTFVLIGTGLLGLGILGRRRARS